jgi:hypothetical protein
MPSARRALLLVLVLVATPMLAGCNLPQWLREQGTVKVFVAPLAASKSRANDFQHLKIGVIGVSLKPLDSIDTKEFVYTGDPRVIDLVADAGKPVEVVSTVQLIRPIEAITVRIEVEDAVDASGHTLPSCHPGEPVASKPCVSTPANGAYSIDQKPVAIPRGGTVDADFPLAVLYDAGSKEYFIQSDPAFFTTTNE